MGDRSNVKPMTRQAANVTLAVELLNDPRHMRIDLFHAAQAGQRQAVVPSRRRMWLVANKEAMDAWNTHVDAYGLPLEEFRQF